MTAYYADLDTYLRDSLEGMIGERFQATNIPGIGTRSIGEEITLGFDVPFELVGLIEEYDEATATATGRIIAVRGTT